MLRVRRASGEVLWGMISGGKPVPSTLAGILNCSINPAEFVYESGEFAVDQAKTIDLVATDTILPPIDEERCPCVWAVGLNYRKHAKEVNMEPGKFPTLFMKSTSTITGPFDNIVKPKVCGDELDYEAELAIIIGKPCKDVAPENALDYVLGFSAANDVSSRRWQGKKGGGQWCRSKSYDTFLPIGPALVPATTMPGEGQNARISTILHRPNQEPLQAQNSNTADMITGIRDIVAFVSQDTTLRPWTVILTGTPEGVGLSRDPPLFLQPGDRVDITLEGAGTLSNKVVQGSNVSSL
mmetsp:Transcript_1630/g.3178  ORF Transcript_1630/g.3178 Transcript_1630/m.3178 type:complete len:296 (-) Transcript_1630:868-1755(-)